MGVSKKLPRAVSFLSADGAGKKINRKHQYLRSRNTAAKSKDPHERIKARPLHQQVISTAIDFTMA